MGTRLFARDPGTVRVGLVLPVTSDIIGFSVRAEHHGFDYLGVAEHITFPGPVPNAFVWLAAAAGATRRIGLVSTIALIPLYPPALFAKLVASLDYVSGGRLAIGVGVGGEYRTQFQAEGVAIPAVDPALDHFRAAGVQIEDRSEVGNEALDVLRTLLGSPGPVEFSGHWTSFAHLEVSPKLENGPPPIWIGGRNEPAVRRAARYADIYLSSNSTVAETVEAREVVRSLASEYGRSPGQIGSAVYLFAVVADDEADGRHQATTYIADLYRQDFGTRIAKFLIGSPSYLVERLSEYIEAGVTEFMIELVCAADRYEEQMLRLAQEVLPFLPRHLVDAARPAGELAVSPDAPGTE
jgi:alkanesulfonate monooxygenase SsuD/methylene tetrahydromethanopterin reductase-like flavin-dependent oxidoreductase (luciferase family)